MRDTLKEDWLDICDEFLLDFDFTREIINVPQFLLNDFQIMNSISENNIKTELIDLNKLSSFENFLIDGNNKEKIKSIRKIMDKIAKEQGKF